MDVKILEDLGLTQAEIKVYICLLEIGSSSAGKLLEKSGLQNSVIHRALNSLIEMGLIGFILEGKKRVYQASDPENFHNFIEDKKTRFDAILPELKKKQNSAKESQEATIYRGARGVKEVYNKLISAKGNTYYTFGGGKRVTFDVMGELWWKSLHTKRIANGIQSKQIFDDTIKDFGLELSKRPLTEIRFLPQTFEQLTETIIIGDYVAIVIFTGNPYALLIKDKAVAESYLKTFNLMWKKAK